MNYVKKPVIESEGLNILVTRVRQPTTGVLSYEDAKSKGKSSAFESEGIQPKNQPLRLGSQNLYIRSASSNEEGKDQSSSVLRFKNQD
jgi:hypothetical protein